METSLFNLIFLTDFKKIYYAEYHLMFIFEPEIQNEILIQDDSLQIETSLPEKELIMYEHIPDSNIIQED